MFDNNFLLITGGILIFLVGIFTGLSLGGFLDKTEMNDLEQQIKEKNIYIEYLELLTK